MVTTLRKKSIMAFRSLSSFLLFSAFIGCSCTDNGIEPSPAPAKFNLALQKEKPQCVHINEITYQSGGAFLNNDPFKGRICSYHQNGNIHTLTSYQNGKKEGLWEIFFADGQKKKSGFTRQGSDDGLYREWFPNGQLKYQYHYDLGKKVDIWKSWYENGTRYTERHFEDDQLNGKVLVWDENGKLAKEYDYVRGQLVNSQMHFKEGN